MSGSIYQVGKMQALRGSSPTNPVNSPKKAEGWSILEWFLSLFVSIKKTVIPLNTHQFVHLNNNSSSVPSAMATNDNEVSGNRPKPVDSQYNKISFSAQSPSNDTEGKFRKEMDEIFQPINELIDRMVGSVEAFEPFEAQDVYDTTGVSSEDIVVLGKWEDEAYSRISKEIDPKRRQFDMWGDPRASCLSEAKRRVVALFQEKRNFPEEKIVFLNFEKVQIPTLSVSETKDSSFSGNSIIPSFVTHLRLDCSELVEFNLNDLPSGLQKLELIGPLPENVIGKFPEKLISLKLDGGSLEYLDLKDLLNLKELENTDPGSLRSPIIDETNHICLDLNKLPQGLEFLEITGEVPVNAECKGISPQSIKKVKINHTFVNLNKKAKI